LLRPACSWLTKSICCARVKSCKPNREAMLPYSLFDCQPGVPPKLSSAPLELKLDGVDVGAAVALGVAGRRGGCCGT
jgi:hypothetical protein